jgi:hypothetical protein
MLQPRFLNVRVTLNVSGRPCQLIGLTPMFLTAIHEGEREEGVFSNDLNEEPGYNTHRISSAERESEDPNRQGHAERETVAERPTEISPDHISDDSHISEETHDTVQFGAFEGEYK